MSWGNLAALAAVGGLSYLDYKNKRKKQKSLEKQYGAWRAAQIAKEMAGGEHHGGGGGGGGAGRASGILSDYYAQAQEYLNPYVEVGKQVLPKQTELFMKALPGAGAFTGQALDPEFLRRAMNYNAPAQAELPAYLMGGKK